MKKIIAILLILSTLCLTACNNQTVETSTSTSKTEQTENTSTSQTTENIQTSETTASSETTSVSETKPYVTFGQNTRFTEMDSRILFTRKNKGNWIGNKYITIGSDRLAYFSKANKEAYLFCFDPLCDHKINCTSLPGMLTYMVFCDYNNRFYIPRIKEILSVSFDGSDQKSVQLNGIEDGVIYEELWEYEKYIFIDALMPDGEHHLLRYEIDSHITRDLTEETGRYITPHYFYDGMIYSSIFYIDEENIENSDIIYCKTDLTLQNLEEIAEYPTGTIAEGQSLISIYDGKIQIYDFAIDAYTIVPIEMPDVEAKFLAFADEHYLYFFDNSFPEIGIMINIRGEEQPLYNTYGGKLWRVKRDGTDLKCIYDNINFAFNNDIYIFEDTILVYGSQVGVRDDGYAYSWGTGVYIGNIDENGMIDKLEWLEIIE